MIFVFLWIIIFEAMYPRYLSSKNVWLSLFKIWAQMRARKWRHVFAKFKINRLQYDDITLIIRHSYIIGERRNFVGDDRKERKKEKYLGSWLFVIQKKVASFGLVTALFLEGDEAYPFNELLLYQSYFFVTPRNGRGSIVFHPVNAYSVFNRLWSH